MYYAQEHKPRRKLLSQQGGHDPFDWNLAYQKAVESLKLRRNQSYK